MAVVGIVRSGLLRALCIAGLLLAGCREERPPAAEGSVGRDTTASTDPEVPPESQFGAEPAVETRKSHQASDVVVVTVNPNGVTWVDGDLAVMFDLVLRLRREREQGRTKVKLLVAEGVPLDGWSQFLPMLDQAGFGEADRTIVFDAPGLGRPESAGPATAPAPQPGPGEPVPPGTGNGR